MQAILEARAAKFSGASSERYSAGTREVAAKLPREAAPQAAAGKGTGLRKFLAALVSALSAWPA
jgi:hypothetical protein